MAIEVKEEKQLFDIQEHIDVIESTDTLPLMIYYCFSPQIMFVRYDLELKEVLFLDGGSKDKDPLKNRRMMRPFYGLLVHYDKEGMIPIQMMNRDWIQRGAHLPKSRINLPIIVERQDDILAQLEEDPVTKIEFYQHHDRLDRGVKDILIEDL